MTVVFLAPNPPDPRGPTGARCYAHLVRQLVGRGHRVRFIVSGRAAARDLSAATAFVDGPSGAFFLRAVEPAREPTWRRKLRSAIWPNRPPAGCPVQAAVDDAVGQGCDVLHVEESAGWYGAGRDRALLSVQHIDSIDLAGERLWTGLSGWKEAVQSRRQETQVIRGYGHIRCLTSSLADAVGQINPGASTYVVPPALDLADYPVLPEPAGEPTIGMIGSMFWHPSREAARRLIRDIFPLVRREVPNARLLIAGWAAHRFLGASAGTDGVEIVSDLPDSESFFRRIHVLLYAPRRASGVKIKVAEALAYGRGVVTTADGTEGLGLTAGDHVLVGATDAELASAACQLLRDRERRRRLVVAGRQVVGDLLSPERTAGQMLEVNSSLCLGR
jgi:glycosyltransferase involved in cell wall biosynthesis